jgi:hypothetical protein
MCTRFECLVDVQTPFSNLTQTIVKRQINFPQSFVLDQRLGTAHPISNRLLIADNYNKREA